LSSVVLKSLKKYDYFGRMRDADMLKRRPGSATMTHFEFTSDLETGNVAIDDQHRSLFALSNALQDSVESGSTDDDVVAD